MANLFEPTIHIHQMNFWSQIEIEDNMVDCHRLVCWHSGKNLHPTSHWVHDVRPGIAVHSWSHTWLGVMSHLVYIWHRISLILHLVLYLFDETSLLLHTLSIGVYCSFFFCVCGCDVMTNQIEINWRRIALSGCVCLNWLNTQTLVHNLTFTQMITKKESF